MIKLRITKARMTEVIRRYRGKSPGVLTELKNGGIDLDRSYTNKIDLKTGDYVFMQEEPVVEGPQIEGTITEVTFESKPKWKNNFTPPTEKYSEVKPPVKRPLEPAKKAKQRASLKVKKAKKGKK